MAPRAGAQIGVRGHGCRRDAYGSSVSAEYVTGLHLRYVTLRNGSCSRALEEAQSRVTVPGRRNIAPALDHPRIGRRSAR